MYFAPLFYIFPLSFEGEVADSTRRGDKGVDRVASGEVR